MDPIIDALEKKFNKFYNSLTEPERELWLGIQESECLIVVDEIMNQARAEVIKQYSHRHVHS